MNNFNKSKISLKA